MTKYARAMAIVHEVAVGPYVVPSKMHADWECQYCHHLQRVYGMPERHTEGCALVAARRLTGMEVPK